MLAKFSHHNLTQIKKKKVLVAVSGGIDSMVLLYLLQNLPLASIGVAHIDHHTRNGKSSQDASFISQYCAQHHIPFHQGDYTHKKGNFQDEARKYRYQFLSKLYDNHGYDLIATAHHYDDHLESFLLGIFRGSGLWGITGIKKVKENIIRPLLHFSRLEISNFANQNGIPYVEDSSNFESDYQRNFLRNQIIPQLEKVIPDFKIKMAKSINLLQSDKKLLQDLIHDVIKPYTEQTNEILKIDIKGILSITNFALVLFHYLKKYGFTHDQVENALTSKTGSIFHATPYIMNKDRDKLIIGKYHHFHSYTIDLPGRYHIGDHYELIIANDSMNDIKGYQAYEEFSAEKLQFPLKVRLWQPGDTFQPLGMNGSHKKIKKYLTELKLNRLQKMKTYVIESDGKICYVLPHRIDERFKVSDPTSIVKIYVIIKNGDQLN